MTMNPTPALLTRRRLVLASTSLTALTLMQPALANTDELAQAVSAYATGKKVTEGKVKLEIAELVDNGNVVPITVSVSSPMTPANHVKAIAVFNEKNPQRETVKFDLGPRYGKSEVSTRIRLATTQKLVAVAHLSDGTFWSHTVEVIVTIAACIEGED